MHNRGNDNTGHLLYREKLQDCCSGDASLSAESDSLYLVFSKINCKKCVDNLEVTKNFVLSLSLSLSRLSRVFYTLFINFQRVSKGNFFRIPILFPQDLSGFSYTFLVLRGSCDCVVCRWFARYISMPVSHRFLFLSNHQN